MDVLQLIGRTEKLFTHDLEKYNNRLEEIVRSSSFLIIGGAGTIGQSVAKEIFKRQPLKLHVVDINENNMVELVRDLRSSLGYIQGDFRTYAIDCGSVEFEALLQHEGPYDYILNLSAMKHVRSEKDPYTLMRLVEVNILNTINSIDLFVAQGSPKYFSVSTDKAANPVNMMGASKRLMELYLMQRSLEISVSTARFANVAFSEGSLLHGFNQRIQKGQPLSAPRDVKRYFITPQESGELCLMSTLLGENRDIFFPKLSDKLHLITFAEIAVKYLEQLGYEAVICATEEEARLGVKGPRSKQKWPVYFFDSDTTGEKDFEEFYTDQELLDMERFHGIGVIKNKAIPDLKIVEDFALSISNMKKQGSWTRDDLVRLFRETVPGFAHKETGKFLDGRM